MAEKVVIDPFTRIEGHLRIEMETEGKQIKKAWSVSTQFRGIETIVQNRDPRDVWAFVQRICGVCTSVHAIASISAVEDAIGSNPPENARLIRSLVLGSQEIQDHVIHFYHLHALDFVNVVNAAKADPQKTLEFAHSIGSKWRGNNLKRFTEVRDTVKQILESGQLSIFTGGYWDHPDYRLPPEADLMCVAHYLDALEFQRSMIRICTVFGGKNPHPNFLVGGMACSIDPNSSESINQVQMDQIKTWIDEIIEFVNDCYYPDVLAIAGVYKDYFDIGATHPNYLAVGLAGSIFSGDPNKSRISSAHTAIKPGVILGGDITKVHPFDPHKIEEYISSAWYEYSVGDDKPLTPDKGETTVKYTGPQPPFEWLGDNDKYTWSKAPRYDGKPMQVGPIARMILAYAQGYEPVKQILDQAMATLGITPTQLNSTMGRTFARAAEATVSAQLMLDDYNQLVDNIKGGQIDVFDASKWEPSSWPAECQGYGFVEVSRGNLSHWVSIKNSKVERYQAVVPTTWLAGGRDANGVTGPYEESLMGTGTHPLLNPKEPLEPMRTIHSYDPCMSCGVHILDPDGNLVGEAMTS
ncbi:nickel-dependent hydrogenase large subunit [Mobiluncus curtisii]|uniref:nickel-dependent hydrogenase large subunit n=1 Tax=Mobiluncus curtisii TaxID=2051 RepID=UPI0014706395|nr:nickel-dependent hydrogenase large subunit [Mobiluncus curtisii]MCV0021394.1 nickel-dependent hydrogenase large subunit [Mobiluncus curtisii]NMW43667.1 nickel-dependent hydrogenase large subunit [Mobiluncus curtisii]NMW47768.1 nickel-dependent hydrogenase large subunit [Mobiluncus curtisii]NMW82386.1 nickel-dependent hydrogenase large subunit [Mobiluncus curtisii]NMW99213.1 nickel-dependent hydrogenase large subunit [Mobiluncus curtisii]